MEDPLNLVIAGVPVALIVFLVVQGLKVFGMVNGNAGRWAIASGLFFGLGALGVELFPEVARYIAVVNRYVVGSLSAGLFYSYLAKPALSRIGVDLSAS